MPIAQKNALFPPNCPLFTRIGEIIAMLVDYSEEGLQAIGHMNAVAILLRARSVLSTAGCMRRA